MTTGNPARATRISTATINSIRPYPAPYAIRDTMLIGFHIIVLPSGQASYFVGARLGGTGKVKRFRIGGVEDIELTVARERARLALDEIRKGVDPLQEKRALVHKGKTLRELIDMYCSVRNLKPRTLKHYEYNASREFAGWMNKRAIDITEHEIFDWYKEGKDTPAQTDGAFRFLNSLMVFARGAKVIKENPCQMVTDLKMRYEAKERTRHIEPNHELGPFFKSLVSYQYNKDSEEVARDLLILLVTTGLRFNEGACLLWENVDLNKGIFTIPDTKNGLNHTVPMTPLAYSMFLHRKEYSEGSKYVFRIKESSKTKSGHVTNVQKTLRNICNKASISVVSTHDLRRTFSTVLNLLETGYFDHKQLMNHKAKAKDMTLRYTQPNIEKLRSVLMKIVDHYDMSFPSMEAGSGYTMRNSGALQHMIYGSGEFVPAELDPMDAAYQALGIEEDEGDLYPWERQH